MVVWGFEGPNEEYKEGRLWHMDGNQWMSRLLVTKIFMWLSRMIYLVLAITGVMKSGDLYSSFQSRLSLSNMINYLIILVVIVVIINLIYLSQRISYLFDKKLY